MNNRHVVVVGVGNIGSHLVPHLGRMPGLARVTLVDRDHYDEGNLAGQDITRKDVGRPKVQVQAARLRRINPGLPVLAVAAAVEALPLGLLRADALLGCVDSRAARQTLNEATRRLGVPWIDAGVQGTGWLTRVSVYPPEARAACLECGWDQHDYDLLDQAYPCRPGARLPPPTDAPSALGALAASMQALECQALLCGGESDGARSGSRQVVVDARHHTHYVTSLRRHPSCRVAEHQPWSIESLAADPRTLTIDDLVRAARATRSRKPTAHPCRPMDGFSLRVAGQRFVTSLRCSGCGRTREFFGVRRRLQTRRRACRRCSRPMHATAFDLLDALAVASLPEPVRGWSLARLGLVTGDVVTLSHSGRRDRHLVIEGDSA